jgi:hypothetical protein
MGEKSSIGSIASIAVFVREGLTADDADWADEVMPLAMFRVSIAESNC